MKGNRIASLLSSACPWVGQKHQESSEEFALTLLTDRWCKGWEASGCTDMVVNVKIQHHSSKYEIAHNLIVLPFGVFYCSNYIYK